MSRVKEIDDEIVEIRKQMDKNAKKNNKHYRKGEPWDMELIEKNEMLAMELKNLYGERFIITGKPRSRLLV